MSNQPQRAMDNSDFLEGIDEQFQRLMKASNNRKENGRSNGHAVEDPLIGEILNQMQVLPSGHRELVLSYIQSLKQKVE